MINVTNSRKEIKLHEVINLEVICKFNAICIMNMLSSTTLRLDIKPQESNVKCISSLLECLVHTASVMLCLIG